MGSLATIFSSPDDALLVGLVLLTDFKDALDGIAVAKVNWHPRRVPSALSKAVRDVSIT